MRLAGDLVFILLAGLVAAICARDLLFALRSGTFTFRAKYGGSKTFLYSRIHQPVSYWTGVTLEMGFVLFTLTGIVLAIREWF
jgi:hypothetical protein